MIPTPWAAAVLVLGAFRVTRLLGWDHLKPFARARAWLLGERFHRSGSSNSLGGYTSEVPETVVTYKRAFLAEMWQCAYCLGFHVSWIVYLLWLWQPRIVLYGAAPFALSAAIGLLARNLDP